MCLNLNLISTCISHHTTLFSCPESAIIDYFILSSHNHNCILLYSLQDVCIYAGMEISGSPFARGDQIHERANGFMSEVARLANCLNHQIMEVID